MKSLPTNIVIEHVLCNFFSLNSLPDNCFVKQNNFLFLYFLKPDEILLSSKLDLSPFAQQNCFAGQIEFGRRSSTIYTSGKNFSYDFCPDEIPSCKTLNNKILSLMKYFRLKRVFFFCSELFTWHNGNGVSDRNNTQLISILFWISFFKLLGY